MLLYRAMKYLNKTFTVTGEGTKAAQDAYREGWTRIFGEKKGK